MLFVNSDNVSNSEHTGGKDPSQLQILNSDKPKKRNREVESLRASGVTNSGLLDQPIRVTRSQWRRSISEKSEQSGWTDNDQNSIHGFNPVSGSTSRSSSRTVSPVSRLRESEEHTDEPVSNGKPNKRRSSGSQSPEARKVNSTPSVQGSRHGKQRKTSRNVSPEHCAGNFGIEKQLKKYGGAESSINKGKGRSHKKIPDTYQSFVAGEESGSTKSPIILSSVGSKGASAEAGTAKERASSALISSKYSSKGLWTSKVFENTAKVAGKKRSRSFSKAQESAGKREKREVGGLPDKSDAKANSKKSGKTGGRLSRGRTSQAQTGERRSTTGSCASSR